MDEEDEDNLDSSICSKDVYDLAADIASEFEKLAAVCGHEPLHPLVSKIILVLEHLETTVCRVQVSKDYATKLRTQISQLQKNKLVNAENKIKLEQDLADVEESWIAEIKDLKCSLSCMQEDNKHLQSLLKEQLFSQQNREAVPDIHLVQELQDIVASLNSRLKDKDALIDKHISDTTLLKSNLEQQNHVNQLLHARVSESQTLVETLWQDKTDLKMKIQKQEELMEIMQHQLRNSMLHSNNYEPSTSSGQPFSSELKEQLLHDESLSHYQHEQEALLMRIEELEHKLVLSERELDEYKKRSGGIKVQPMQSLSSKSSAIRQLFRFFLGVVARETENFRS